MKKRKMALPCQMLFSPYKMGKIDQILVEGLIDSLEERFDSIALTCEEASLNRKTVKKLRDILEVANI